MIASVGSMAITTVALIALCALGCFGEIDHVEMYRGVIVARTNTICGVSVGGFVALRSAYHDSDLAHEYGHVKQWQLLGPLYLPLVALPSVALNIAGRYGLINMGQYYDSWPESWADELGGVYAIR